MIICNSRFERKRKKIREKQTEKGEREGERAEQKTVVVI